MADKSTQLVLDALGRAAAEPAGLPMHGGKAAPGLFAATGPGKQAAQVCKDEGYLRVVRTETKGKTAQEICALSEKGLAYLLRQIGPRPVLEQFVQALAALDDRLAQQLDAGQQTRASLDALQAAVGPVLEAVGTGAWLPGKGNESAANGHCNGTAPVNGRDSHPAPENSFAHLIACLAKWQEADAPEDCSLPELYRQVRQAAPALTVGGFHDGLRRLYADERIYLHPWTGPLYEIPEPTYALLCGHQIAYYASLRQP